MKKITLMLVVALATMLTTSALADKGPNGKAGQGPILETHPDLLGAVEALAEKIIELEESGQLKHGQAQKLLNKLDKAARALEGSGAGSGDITAQQLPLEDLDEVLRAITGFLRELTRIVTDLPAEVIQPIIEATLDLIDEIIGLLLP